MAIIISLPVLLQAFYSRLLNHFDRLLNQSARPLESKNEIQFFLAGICCLLNHYSRIYEAFVWSIWVVFGRNPRL